MRAFFDKMSKVIWINPFGAFETVEGSHATRQKIFKRNQSKKHILPKVAMFWGLLTMIMFQFGSLLYTHGGQENGFVFFCAVCCFISMAIMIPMTLVLVLAWVFLGQSSEQEGF